MSHVAFAPYVEKLDVWKKSARLSAEFYKGTADLKDDSFRDQLTRSGLSVPSNIAEGMTRSSKKEKCRFLKIARSSLAEERTQIYIGIDIGYLSSTEGKDWLEQTRHISMMITGLMKAVESNE
jgi:four helix bundle protein